MVQPPKATSETVDIAGHRFTIKKLDPEAGSYWAFRLLGEMMSSGAVSLDGGLDMPRIMDKIQAFTQMERKAFKEFRQDCLSVVLVELPSGATPLMNPTGHIVVDVGVEIQFMLTLRSFMFTIMDFFSLADLMVPPQTQQTSTPSANASSTPPLNTGFGDSTSYGTAPTQPPIG